MNICVSEKDWQDPMMREAVYLSGLHVSCTNDVFSYDKEVVEENGDLSRLFYKYFVQFFITKENLTREQAKDKVVKIILDAEGKIWSLDNEYCSRNDITDDGKTMMKHIHCIFGTLLHCCSLF